MKVKLSKELAETLISEKEYREEIGRKLFNECKQIAGQLDKDILNKTIRTIFDSHRFPGHRNPHSPPIARKITNYKKKYKPLIIKTISIKLTKMNEKFEFTKEELVEAFKLYNTDALDNPDNYGHIDKTEDCAMKQAEMLISFLPIHEKAD